MFTEEFNGIDWDHVSEMIYSSSDAEVESSLASERRSPTDIAALLSPAADSHLEELAAASKRITKIRFGNVIQLYVPLYISNECNNSCLYCGFNRNNQIRRSTLSMDQVVAEADLLYRKGFRHLLLLTGESRRAVPLETLAGIASTVHKKFASVSIEMYPMEIEEYQIMEKSGVDGLTIYQETYNKKIYADVHLAGKKRDFYWRLEAPDRGGCAGFRKIGIGALLGLSDWRIDGFFTALHALNLTRKYWKSHIQVSFPRLRGAPGNFKPLIQVTDRDLTHLICAMRIILPDAGLVLSTREPDYLRDNLFPLGITMMSAGSKTEPGGYSGLDIADNQFTVVDSRTPEEISEVIRKKGFDPVWKDWDSMFLS